MAEANPASSKRTLLSCIAPFRSPCFSLYTFEILDLPQNKYSIAYSSRMDLMRSQAKNNLIRPTSPPYFDLVVTSEDQLATKSLMLGIFISYRGKRLGTRTMSNCLMDRG